MTAERAPWASSHPDGEPRSAERPPSVVGHAGASAEPDHVTAAFLQQRAVRLDPASRPAGHPSRRWSAADVTGADVTSHLVALERIADENGGNRASPSPGYEASVEYVTWILRAAGYDVTTPVYPLPKRRRRGRRTSCRNVIAQTRTGDPRWIVMVGAHLDSVRKGPGINDNGSGVAALLEIAARLGGSPVTRSTVRFAFWGS